MKVVLKCKYGPHAPLSIVEVSEATAKVLIAEGNAVEVKEEVAPEAPKVKPRGAKDGKDS